MMSNSQANPDAITPAIDWIVDLLTGTLATSIAMLAVAAIGFEMLRGELRWQNAARVLMGCFILFSAKSITGSLINLARGTEPSLAPLPAVPPPQPTKVPPGFDPYSGASVPTAESQAH